jgi:protein phosphatase
MVNLTWGSATDEGLIRDSNEDSHIATPPIFAVADGMGGLPAGEEASAIAVQVMAALATREGRLDATSVLAAVAEANTTILATAVGEREGMGTTLTGLALVAEADEDRWLVFNVGDSRVYRLHDGVLTQLTTDHTEAQRLFEEGYISEEEVRYHPTGHLLTRALGTDPAIETDSVLLTPTPGERFLICSDGINVDLTDDEIRDCLAEGGTAQEAAERVIAAGLLAGGRDNLTAVVVDVLAP